jgi:hypothetical protein
MPTPKQLAQFLPAPGNLLDVEEFVFFAIINNSGSCSVAGWGLFSGFLKISPSFALTLSLKAPPLTRSPAAANRFVVDL